MSKLNVLKALLQESERIDSPIVTENRAIKLAIEASDNDKDGGKLNLFSLYHDGMIDYAGPRLRDWRICYCKEDLNEWEEL